MWGGRRLQATLQLLTILVRCDSEQFGFGSVGQCSNHHQQTAFEVHNKHRCNTREELVKLEVPSDGSVIQVLPSHVMVARCSGSCITNPGKSCVPQDYRMKEVSVMLVTPSYSSGPWQTMCSVQRVREDITCVCGCSVLESDCSGTDQYYDTHHCRCRCRNTEDRRHCVDKGKVWDSTTCSCVCDPSSWRVCSTGYLYDSIHTCQCVQAHYQARTPVAGLIGVVCLGVLIVITYVMYRQRIRRRDGRRESLARVLEDESEEVR